MELGDLADYTAPFVDPTHVDYRGYDVYSMAPSSSGGSTVGESLNILGNFDLSRETRVQALHHFLESTRLAFADRNRYVGDPRFVNVPLAQLLSKPFGRQRACLINPAHALTSPVAPGDPFAGDGRVLAAAADRRRPAQRRRRHQPFRCRRPTGRRRLLHEHDRGARRQRGSSSPGAASCSTTSSPTSTSRPLQAGVPDPNLPAAGKRPRSSMSPTIVLRHGRPFMAVGAAGGATIITSVLEILMDKIDFGMSLPDAIAAPRASQRNSATTQAEPAFIAQPTTPGLEALGQTFSITDTSPLDPSIKIAPTISVATGLQLLGGGKILAAGEPERRGGSAAGVVSPSG